VSLFIALSINHPVSNNYLLVVEIEHFFYSIKKFYSFMSKQSTVMVSILVAANDVFRQQFSWNSRLAKVIIDWLQTIIGTQHESRQRSYTALKVYNSDHSGCARQKLA